MNPLKPRDKVTPVSYTHLDVYKRQVNTKVGEIASDVGSTPQDWNGGIFSMLQNLSETVIVPIAAAILALVMCYELIDMIVELSLIHI